MWPADADSLIARQKELALATPDPVAVEPSAAFVGGCWVCLPRGLAGPGTDRDPAWCAVVIMQAGKLVEQQVIMGTAGAPYVPGLLALRLGRLMEDVVRALSSRPDVLLLDATAADHPRRAGLALHLGGR
jgi:deoxyribonuclease V